MLSAIESPLKKLGVSTNVRFGHVILLNSWRSPIRLNRPKTAFRQKNSTSFSSSTDFINSSNESPAALKELTCLLGISPSGMARKNCFSTSPSTNVSNGSSTARASLSSNSLTCLTNFTDPGIRNIPSLSRCSCLSRASMIL